MIAGPGDRVTEFGLPARSDFDFQPRRSLRDRRLREFNLRARKSWSPCFFVVKPPRIIPAATFGIAASARLLRGDSSRYEQGPFC